MLQGDYKHVLPRGGGWQQIYVRLHIGLLENVEGIELLNHCVLGTRRATRSTFHAQILGSIMQNCSLGLPGIRDLCTANRYVCGCVNEGEDRCIQGFGGET